MTLQQRIQACKDQTAAIRQSNPKITNVWYHLNDCDYKEMKEIQKNGDAKTFDPATDGKRMRLQVGDSASTIFAYSKPLKIITTIEVIEIPELVTA